MTEDELHSFIIDFLDEILVLTGAEEYESDLRKSFLIKSIENLINFTDGMLQLTKNELKHAVYLNHSGAYGKIHHIYHGKTISADYIGNIYHDYRQYKIRSLETEYAINRLLNPPEEKKIPVYTVEDYKKFIQYDYELFQRGDTNMIFNIEKKYLLLRLYNGKGIIIYPNGAAYKKWYKIALTRREQEALKTTASTDGEKVRKKLTMSMYQAIRKTHIMPSAEHYSVVFMVKKVVYLRFLELMYKDGIVDIFKEVHHCLYDKDMGIVFRRPEDVEEKELNRLKTIWHNSCNILNKKYKIEHELHSSRR